MDGFLSIWDAETFVGWISRYGRRREVEEWCEEARILVLYFGSNGHRSSFQLVNFDFHSFSHSLPPSLTLFRLFFLVIHPFFEFLLFSSFSFFVSFFFCVWLKHVRNTLHILILIPNVVEFVVIYDMWNCIFL